MKKLIWKELREHRWTPIVYGILTSLAVMACYVSGQGHDFDMGTLNVGVPVGNPNGVLTRLIIALLLAGLFPACGAIASEVGEGTLAFLSSLPSGRERIWRAKIGAGLIVLAGSVLCIIAAYDLTLVCIYQFAGVYNIPDVYHIPEQLAWSGGAAFTLTLVVLVLFGYAMAFFCSTLVDRPLSAAVLAVIGEAGIISLVPTMNFGTVLTDVVYIFLIAAVLSASYVAFVSGDAMRSGRHLGLAGLVLACWLTVGGAAFATGIKIQQVRDAAHLRLMESVLHTNPKITIVTVNAPLNTWQAQSCNLDAVTVGLTYSVQVPLMPNETWNANEVPASAGDPSEPVTAAVRQMMTIRGSQTVLDITYVPRMPEGDDTVYIPLRNKNRTFIGYFTLNAAKFILRGRSR